MKIEKINDNQIRCTLTKEDLASRQIKISELAYGTERAKNLFRDMMQQANNEFGFDAEDIPLMIEAIPLGGEGIVLIITKVEDPDELDTRFARFAPPDDEEDDEENYDDEPAQMQPSPDDMMELFRRIHDGYRTGTEKTKDQPSDEAKEEMSATQEVIFRLNSMQTAIDAAAILDPHFEGESTLYRDAAGSQYLLLLTRGDMSVQDFTRVTNILSEYGTLCSGSDRAGSYLEEHCEPLTGADAIHILASLT